MKRPHLPKLPRLNITDDRLFQVLLLIFTLLHAAYAALLMLFQALHINYIGVLLLAGVALAYGVKRLPESRGLRRLLRVLSILPPAAATALSLVQLAFLLGGYAQTTAGYTYAPQNPWLVTLMNLCLWVYPLLLTLAPALVLAARRGGRWERHLLRVHAVAWLLLACAAAFGPHELLYKSGSLLSIPPVAFRAMLALIAAGATALVFTAHPPAALARLLGRLNRRVGAKKEEDKP